MVVFGSQHYASGSFSDIRVCLCLDFEHKMLFRWSISTFLHIDVIRYLHARSYTYYFLWRWSLRQVSRPLIKPSAFFPTSWEFVHLCSVGIIWNLLRQIFCHFCIFALLEKINLLNINLTTQLVCWVTSSNELPHSNDSVSFLTLRLANHHAYFTCKSCCIGTTISVWTEGRVGSFCIQPHTRNFERTP